MDFALSEDQRALQDLCTRLAGTFEDSYWQAIDEECRFPREFWDRMAQAGILGIAVPTEYGGSGLGLLDMCLAAEALSEHGAPDAGAIFVGGPVFGGCLIAGAGSPAQKARYLPGIVAGDVWAGAFTEPNSGSNITTIRTEAHRDADGYVVRGQKVYISNVAPARHIAIMCRTSAYDSAHRTDGVSLLVGDLPSAQVEARPFKKLGAHFMDTNQVFFDDYRIPADNLVGEEGKGWRP